MTLHDRSHRIDQLITTLLWESTFRMLRAERARRALTQTITVDTGGTARLPHDWQACTESERKGCNSGNPDPFIPQLAGE